MPPSPCHNAPALTDIGPVWRARRTLAFGKSPDVTFAVCHCSSAAAVIVAATNGAALPFFHHFIPGVYGCRTMAKCG